MKKIVYQEPPRNRRQNKFSPTTLVDVLVNNCCTHTPLNSKLHETNIQPFFLKNPISISPAPIINNKISLIFSTTNQSTSNTCASFDLEN